MKRELPYRVWYRWRGVYLGHHFDKHAARLTTLDDARIVARRILENPEITFLEIRRGAYQIEVLKG